MLQSLKDQFRPEDPTPGRSTQSFHTETVSASVEPSTIGASIRIKGEVHGSEPLYLEGSVEGGIHCPGHRVTIGRKGSAIANISADAVIVMGTVRGDVACTDFAEVRADASLTGDIVARRIRVEEGAVLKGRVEIRGHAREDAQPAEAKKAVAKPEPAVQVVSIPVELPKPPQPVAEVNREAERVKGSSVLLVPSRDK